MYKLSKHYRKYQFPFECQFDRGGIDPAPTVTEWEETVKDFKEDLNIVEALWKVAMGIRSKSSANNAENQPSPTPSLESQDSVDLSTFSDSSSETDSEAIHPSEPAFGPGEPSSPPPTKAPPGASNAEYLYLILLTISYLLTYYRHILSQNTCISKVCNI